MDLEMHLQRKRLQRDLYFNQLIRFNSFDISFYLFPEDKVSGDFYGVYELGDENIGILIGDVSGKGINSAIIAAFFKSIVSKLAKTVYDPGEILSCVNREIYDILPRGNFVAAGFYKLNTRKHIIEYSTAGIPNAYLKSRSNDLYSLSNEGNRIVLGVFKDSTYRTQRLELRKDDIVMIYTDGLSEAKGNEGDRYGESRVQEIIKKYKHRESDFILNRIIEDLNRYLSSSDLNDDMLLFLIKASQPDIKNLIAPRESPHLVVQWRTIVTIFLKTSAARAVFESGLEQYKADMEQFRDDVYIINIGSADVYADIISRGLDCALYLRSVLAVIDDNFELGINMQRIPLTTEGRLDWSIALDSISRAIHYSSLKKASILVDSSIYNLSKDLFNYRGLDTIKDEKLYELLSKKPFEEISMELIDREAELSFISQLSSSRTGEKADIVTVHGGTGSGKTPYILYAKRILQKNGYLCLINTCSSFTQDIPFYVWLDPLKALLSVDTNPENDLQIQNLKKYLSSIRLYSQELFDTLTYIFGYHSEKPKDITSIFRDFIIKYIRYLSYKRPICIIFEDIEFINHKSFEVIRDIVLQGIPLMFMLSFKTIAEDLKTSLYSFKNSGRVYEISFSPLKQKDIKNYIKNKLSEFAVSTGDINSLNKKVFQITQGNHLFTTEIVALVIEDLKKGISVPDILKNPSLLISNNVKAIIESRILKLDPTQLKILQVASVYGGRFPLNFLDYVLGEYFSQDFIFHIIEILTTYGFIYLYQPPDIYIFKNMLYKDIIYFGLLEEDKIRLHHLASKYIMNMAEDSKRMYNPLRLKILASKHLEKSLHIRESVQMILEIVSDLKKAYNYNDAQYYISRGKLLLENMDNNSELLFDLYYEDAFIMLFKGQLQEGKLEIDRLKNIYINLNDNIQYYKINLIKGYYYNNKGEYLKGLKLLEQLDLRALRESSYDLYIEASILKARLLNRIGHANKAVRIFSGLQVQMPDSINYRILILEGLCDSSLFNGHYKETIFYANRLLGLIKGKNKAFSDSRVMYYLARAYFEIGNLSLSRKYIKDNAVFNKRTNYYEGKAWNFHLLFLYFTTKGKLNTGLNEINRAFSIFSEIDNKYGLSILQYNMANFYLNIGCYKKAEKYLKSGIRNAKRVKAAGALFSNLCVGIQLYSALGDYASANSLFKALYSIYWVAESKFYRYKILIARSAYYRSFGDIKSYHCSMRMLNLAEKKVKSIFSRLYRYTILGEQLLTLFLLKDYESAYNILLQMKKYWESLYTYQRSEHYLAVALKVLEYKDDKREYQILSDYFTRLKQQRIKEAEQIKSGKEYSRMLSSFL